MKIAGKALVKRNKAEVTVVRGEDRFEMIITSLPVGWHDMVLSQRLIQPVAPEKFVTDASGQVIRNANKTVQTKPDFADPKFRRKSDIWQGRYNSLGVCDLLREDETVVWESVPPDEKTGSPEEWEAFADGITVELNAAGFTDTDVEQILGLGREISSSVNIEGALKRFLSSQDTTTEPEKV